MLVTVILLVGVVACAGALAGAVAPGAVTPGALAPPAPLVAETGEEALAKPGAFVPQSSRQSANSAALRAFELDCLRTAAPTTTRPFLATMALQTADGQRSCVSSSPPCSPRCGRVGRQSSLTR